MKITKSPDTVTLSEGEVIEAVGQYIANKLGRTMDRIVSAKVFDVLNITVALKDEK